MGTFNKLSVKLQYAGHSSYSESCTVYRCVFKATFPCCYVLKSNREPAFHSCISFRFTYRQCVNLIFVLIFKQNKLVRVTL